MPDSPVPSVAGTPRTPPAALAERCGEWYERHGRAVYRYIRFQVSSADVADDVTSETFLKAFQAGERYDPARGDARVWLFRIAQNTLRDHLRRTRIRRHLPIGSLRDLASTAPSAEERVLWEEQVGRLLEAVAMLSSRDAEIISLRYGSGFDTQAVAEILGLRESAVRTRLWRALARLRGLLGEEK